MRFKNIIVWFALCAFVCVCGVYAGITYKKNELLDNTICLALHELRQAYYSPFEVVETAHDKENHIYYVSISALNHERYMIIKIFTDERDYDFTYRCEVESTTKEFFPQ